MRAKSQSRSREEISLFSRSSIRRSPIPRSSIHRSFIRRSLIRGRRPNISITLQHAWCTLRQDSQSRFSTNIVLPAPKALVGDQHMFTKGITVALKTRKYHHPFTSTHPYMHSPTQSGTPHYSFSNHATNTNHSLPPHPHPLHIQANTTFPAQKSSTPLQVYSAPLSIPDPTTPSALAMALPLSQSRVRCELLIPGI